jgi:arginyl-tRNA synthetase
MDDYAPVMTPEDLSAAVRSCIVALQAEGAFAGPAPDDVVIERPKNRDHGDYATPVALTLAKAAGRPPREVAELIAGRLLAVEGVTEAEVAGPGFINIRLGAEAQGVLARQVVDAGPAYGGSDQLAGRRFNVEFISANPTGPIHLGHTRWAAVGDALARVISAAGAEVSTEFYINDRGVQMDRFGASVMAVAHGQPVPEDGYHGAYIADLAARIVAEHPEYLAMVDDDQLVAFREAAYALQLAEQQHVLALFQIGRAHV